MAWYWRLIALTVHPLGASSGPFTVPSSMKHFSASSIKHIGAAARRGALLLGLSGLGLAAQGQSFAPMASYSLGVFFQPTSVALGDIDGDGRLDIVVIGAASNAVRVFSGQAGGTFAAVYTSYPTPGNRGFGFHPRCLKLGDVNGDGRLDVVVTNTASSSVSVLLGLASGGLAPAATYMLDQAGNTPTALALGDVNGDGRIDIALTCGSIGSNVSVLLGQAGGWFGGPIAHYPILASGPYGLALGDVNGDGRLDAVTANSNTDDVSVLLGQSNGTLASVGSYTAGRLCNLNDVALGDVNADGQLDIIAANSYHGNVGIFFGQSGGLFAPVTDYSSGARSTPYSLALGDMNGDGRLDIVLSDYGRAMAILLGQGSRRFAPVITFPTPGVEGLNSVALGDVNGDGKLDMVTANFLTHRVGVFLSTTTPLATARPAAADITLSPNPAHGRFTVQLPAGFTPTSAALLNALGQVVRRPVPRPASFAVETSGLPPGVYTLCLQAGGAALARRVVVE